VKAALNYAHQPECAVGCEGAVHGPSYTFAQDDVLFVRPWHPKQGQHNGKLRAGHWVAGFGDPNVTGVIGNIDGSFQDLDGKLGESLYIKETGSMKKQKVSNASIESGG